MSARMSRASARSGGCLGEEALRRLGVGEDDGQRLVQLVRERARQLAHSGDAGEVGQFLVLLLRRSSSACLRAVMSIVAPIIRTGFPWVSG